MRAEPPTLLKMRKPSEKYAKELLGPVQKAAKKPKRADEEEEVSAAAAADRPARADKDSRSLVRAAPRPRGRALPAL